MQIPATKVKELRQKTGAGMMACKEALQEAEGDVTTATEILRKKGLAEAKKRVGRSTKEGLVEAYVHNSRLGALVEVNCETDFVARNEEFRGFVRDMAMQVVAARPSFVSREDVPEEVVNKEREIAAERAKDEGKPEKVIEKIVTGRLERFYKENCLLEQTFIKDEEVQVGAYLGAVAAKFGENVIISRFTVFELGGAD